MDVKRKRQQKFLWVLILLTLAFIWGHSMVPEDLSAEESGRLAELLAPLWQALSIGDGLANHIVRKCAHFFEYMVFGGELCLHLLLALDEKELSLFAARKSKRDRENEYPKMGLLQKLFSFPITQSATVALFVALTDETIQIFSNRGSQVQDVWLDFCGACVGSLVVYGVWRKSYQRGR